MKFRYVAFDAKGQRKVGVIEAASASEARDQISREGRFPIEVDQTDDSASLNADARQSVGGLIHIIRSQAYLAPLAEFSRELSILVSNGTPVIDAISALERQTRHPGFRLILADIRKRVEEGVPFSEVLARHPLAFDDVSVSLIAAGESGADLDIMLARLHEFAEGKLHIRKTLTGAMVYPAVLSLISLGVLIALFVVVLPRFSEMFQTMQVPLPASTAALIATGDFVTQWWWAIIIVTLAALVTAAWWIATPSSARAVDRVLVTLPVIGKAFRSFNIARITRILGTLIEARVPFLDALQLAKRGVVSPAFHELLDEAEDHVSKGDSVASAFAESPLVTPALAEAIRNAESAGRLGPVLSAMAAHQETDNEAMLKSITKLAEPIILAILGVVVGFVAISLFLPLFDLTASAGTPGGP